MRAYLFVMDDGGDSDSTEYDERFLESQYEQEYTDADFLEAIGTCAVATTRNVADEIGCNRTTALRRLNALEEHGEIEVSERAAGAKVWTVVGE